MLGLEARNPWVALASRHYQSHPEIGSSSRDGLSLSPPKGATETKGMSSLASMALRLETIPYCWKESSRQSTRVLSSPPEIEEGRHTHTASVTCENIPHNGPRTPRRERSREHARSHALRHPPPRLLRTARLVNQEQAPLQQQA